MAKLKHYVDTDKISHVEFIERRKKRLYKIYRKNRW